MTGTLIGSRIDDPSQTIDDTHINDGNDGIVTGGSTTNISLSPLNDGDKTTYVEIPPGATLTFDDGSTRSDTFGPTFIICRGICYKDNQTVQNHNTTTWN